MIENKIIPEIEVSNEILRSCLELAIKRFNSNDRATLLCPKRLPSGYEEKHEKGWGGASERSISHRLAFYLECELRKIGIIRDGGLVVVDCEYNRHLDGMKHIRISEELIEIVKKAKRKLKRISDDEDGVVSIAPDIVVHQRGEDDLNLLVIEVKKTSNREIPKYDALKLSCFTRQTEGETDEYGYQLGFAVVAIDNKEKMDDRKLEILMPYAKGMPQAENYAKKLGR